MNYKYRYPGDWPPILEPDWLGPTLTEPDCLLFFRITWKLQIACPPPQPDRWQTSRAQPGPAAFTLSPGTRPWTLPAPSGPALIPPGPPLPPHGGQRLQATTHGLRILRYSSTSPQRKFPLGNPRGLATETFGWRQTLNQPITEHR